MELPPFLLDRWIEQKNTADPPIEFDLASSTGPVWTLRELVAIAGGRLDDLLDTRVSYTSAAGSPPLRAAIANLEGVQPEDVQIVSGASEALLILFFLAAGPDANVVLPKPGFPANTDLADCFGIEARYYDVLGGTDLDQIRSLVDRETRLVLVNSPHNPTGVVFSDVQMQALHDFCAERRVPFVSDQVYHPIYHGEPMQSAARLPHATVIGDFSKALCLSGLRLGWIVERDPARRKQYRNARNHFTITGTALGERLAVLALEHADQIYGRARQVASGNLALLDTFFNRHADLLSWTRPQGGMTAFGRLAHGDARDFCRRLAKRGVLIVPGDCFGEPSHFRLGFAASAERFPLAIERFSEFLEGGAGAFACPA